MNAPSASAAEKQFLINDASEASQWVSENGLDGHCEAAT